MALESVHGYVDRLAALFDQMGTWWHFCGEPCPVDLRDDFNLLDLIHAVRDGSDPCLSGEDAFTISLLAAYALRNIQSNHIIGADNRLGIRAAFNALPQVLRGKPIFILDDKLAEQVIYGGCRFGQDIGGWRGIEALTFLIRNVPQPVP